MVNSATTHKTSIALYFKTTERIFLKKFSTVFSLSHMGAEDTEDTFSKKGEREEIIRNNREA